VLALDPKFAVSNPAEDDTFLRVIKVSSPTSFGGEVKPLVPCHEILCHVKECYKYERDTSQAKLNGHFFAKFLLLCYIPSSLYPTIFHYPNGTMQLAYITKFLVTSKLRFPQVLVISVSTVKQWLLQEG
jgi:hypothetical protein